MEKMKILSVVNQKGGVGKTTVCIALGLYAAQQGQRVLMVDLDGQASMSLYFNANAGLSALALFSDVESADEPFFVNENLAVIRGEQSLINVDRAPVEYAKSLKKSLERFSGQFDVCFIDTAGTLGLRLNAALIASNYVITPVSVGLFEMDATNGLLQTIQRARGSLNPMLKHVGILPVKTNPRSKAEVSDIDKLREAYPNVFMNHLLHERAAVKHAVRRRKAIWDSPKDASHKKAAAEWLGACAEVLGKMGVVEK